MRRQLLFGAFLAAWIGLIRTGAAHAEVAPSEHAAPAPDAIATSNAGAAVIGLLAAAVLCAGILRLVNRVHLAQRDIALRSLRQGRSVLMATAPAAGGPERGAVASGSGMGLEAVPSVASLTRIFREVGVARLAPRKSLGRRGAGSSTPHRMPPDSRTPSSTCSPAAQARDLPTDHAAGRRPENFTGPAKVLLPRLVACATWQCGQARDGLDRLGQTSAGSPGRLGA